MHVSDGQSRDVTSAGVLVLPEATPRKDLVTDYATGAHAEGAVIKTSNGALYWAAVGGAAAVGPEPTHNDGDATDGDVTWRFHRWQRERFTLVNDGAETMYVNYGTPATINTAIRINAFGGSISEPRGDEPCPQGAIYAITVGAGPFKIVIHEG